MKRMGTCVVVASLALVTWACAPRTQTFQPAERGATVQTPTGYLAAEYVLSTPHGNLGEAKVWSDGAFERDFRGRTETVIHVGFELENYTPQPLYLSSLVLDSASLDRRLMRDVQAIQVQGATTVAPRSSARLQAFFPVPADVRPHQIDAFRVRWQIRNDGLSYTQTTPFVESRTEQLTPYYYYTPFFDPFFYDPYLFHPRIIVVRRPYRHVHAPPLPTPPHLHPRRAHPPHPRTPPIPPRTPRR